MIIEELLEIRKEMLNLYKNMNPNADLGHDSILLSILLHPIDQRLKVLNPSIKLYGYTLKKKEWNAHLFKN